ncbi:uncharacterized protein STAUR_2483 [Stigmatella aurantiaca DW4/3-1]|uniref:Uncharacterized protein n=1 Tax=Stigmatella aurantiaca (strain DW4/3-1) TaxID=378806 RepID=E3FGF2_STIAD|nr:uncharacterized protein STAUR_2483 [Stigmatella aurantiaca DW4/3-1]
MEEPQANPLQAVRMHGTLVVVESLAHLWRCGASGACRSVRGAVACQAVGGTPRRAAGTRAGEAGNLVVGTTNQRLDEVVRGRVGAFAHAHVLRVTGDGRVAPFESDGRS